MRPSPPDWMRRCRDIWTPFWPFIDYGYEGWDAAFLLAQHTEGIIAGEDHWGVFPARVWLKLQVRWQGNSWDTVLVPAGSCLVHTPQGSFSLGGWWASHSPNAFLLTGSRLRFQAAGAPVPHTAECNGLWNSAGCVGRLSHMKKNLVSSSIINTHAAFPKGVQAEKLSVKNLPVFGLLKQELVVCVCACACAGLWAPLC